MTVRGSAAPDIAVTRSGLRIEAEDLVQVVRGGHRTLRGVSLTVEPGELVAIIGADATQATLMLPMLCFPQVLFVGAILPVPVMAPVGRWVSWAMSNRWCFEALGHTLGVEHLWRAGGSPLGPPLLATYGDTFSRPVWVDWLVLAGFAALFFAATCAVLAGKHGRRGRAG